VLPRLASRRGGAHLAEEAGDQFPDVVKTILPFLGPVDHADMLIYGAKKNLASRFPEPMLALLDRVIPDAAPVPPHDLRSILEMIVVAEPTLRQDSRWLRLDTLAG
jgi:hypothetical protein